MIEKSEGALLNIGELAADLGVPQHILRFWETRFPKLKPLTRAGSRRYYRTEDVALARRIHKLLYEEGYTVKGAQKLLAERGQPSPSLAESPPPPVAAQLEDEAVSVASLMAIRDRLARALAQQ